jgi:streptogramin lyase
MCWKLIRKSFSLLLIMIPIALAYPTPGQAKSTPQFQEFPGPLKATPPVSIVAGTDGNIWFSQMNSSNVGRFNRKSGQIQKYALECECPPMIALDKNNNLWASTDSNSFDVFASQTGQRTRYFDPLTTDSTFPQTEALAVMATFG